MLGSLSPKRLSGKLLLMTIGFVMLAELVIFVPSAAIHRQNWLSERINQVDILNLALQGVEDFQASNELTQRVMNDTDIVMAAERHDGMSQLLLGAPPTDDQTIVVIDITKTRKIPKFIDFFKTFFGPSHGYYRVIGNASIPKDGNIEIIIPRENIKLDLRAYFKNIFFISLAIAIITGSLIYLTMALLIIRPIQSIAQNVASFQNAPETAPLDPIPSQRGDEIGDLQRAVADMKQSVRGSLKQRQRLATLGLAVAKINHDLRNVLTSAQLISDRLTTVEDPKVARMGDRLTRAIDRGVKLTRDVLNFSNPVNEPVKSEPMRISFLLGEVAGDVLPNFGTGPRRIKFMNDVPSDLQVAVDGDHSYRIFHNLMRNAAQAMAALTDDNAERLLRVYVDTGEDYVNIHVADTAGGLPDNAKDKLFRAFASGGGRGSTGLGLTIAKELAQAQGGDLRLERTSQSGTVFTVTLMRYQDNSKNKAKNSAATPA